MLDTRQIIKGLEGESEHRTDQDVQAWQESSRIGTGRATTARGPVFHRVSLDEKDRVVQWRAVAPTDWHFAPSGPVAKTLGEVAAEKSARLAIAGFDPCAPWTLEPKKED